MYFIRKKKKTKKDKEKLKSYAKDLISDDSASSEKINPIRVVTKTEAELKFEEIQRKRVSN